MGQPSLYVARNEALRRMLARDRAWRLVDARDQVLGRLAVQVSRLLRGMHKPYARPDQHVLPGDPVVVINARHVALTGKKHDQKVYYRHSGYPGGLKAQTARRMLERKPEEVIRLAVSRMLPKNRQQKRIIAELLRIYPDAEHPHAAQQPLLVAPSWRLVGASGRDEEKEDERRQADAEFAWRQAVQRVAPQHVRGIIDSVRGNRANGEGGGLRDLL